MELRPHILKVLKAQIKVTSTFNELQERLRKANEQMTNLNGQLQAFAELYREQTGRDLQTDINQSDEWREDIARLVEGGDEPTTPQPPQLRKVTGNKQVDKPVDMTQPEQPIVRKVAPVRPIIDDSPPTAADRDDD